MSFHVTPSERLRVATDLVQSSVLRFDNLRRSWTPEQLVEYFGERQIVFTLGEMERINDELHKRQIVEDDP